MRQPNSVAILQHCNLHLALEHNMYKATVCQTQCSFTSHCLDIFCFYWQCELVLMDTFLFLFQFLTPDKKDSESLTPTQKKNLEMTWYVPEQLKWHQSLACHVDWISPVRSLFLRLGNFFITSLLLTLVIDRYPVMLRWKQSNGNEASHVYK